MATYVRATARTKESPRTPTRRPRPCSESRTRCLCQWAHRTEKNSPPARKIRFPPGLGQPCTPRERAPTVAEAARRWRASRIDIRPATASQHASAIARLLPILGHVRVDRITAADVADMVQQLVRQGRARETVRKTLTALAMILDWEGITPNPARDRVRVRLPREESQEIEPPSAEQVEAVVRLLPPHYRLAVLVLEATGARIGEVVAARVGDLDEERRAWLVRAAVSKTRRPRWIPVPDDLFAVVIDRLVPRDDRKLDSPLFPDLTDARLRMAIARACRAAGVPVFSPHALRHRRISLLHRQGMSWADIGALVGQRSRAVTADIYSHAMVDPREIDRTAILDIEREDRPGSTQGAPSVQTRHG